MYQSSIVPKSVCFLHGSQMERRQGMRLRSTSHVCLANYQKHVLAVVWNVQLLRMVLIIVGESPN